MTAMRNAQQEPRPGHGTRPGGPGARVESEQKEEGKEENTKPLNAAAFRQRGALVVAPPATAAALPGKHQNIRK